MGYRTRNGSIRTFTPDDNKDTLYINTWNGTSLENIREGIQTKWPGIKDNELNFEAEHIQTDCIGYDRYDSSDYTDYLVVRASEEYFVRIKNESAVTT